MNNISINTDKYGNFLSKSINNDMVLNFVAILNKNISNILDILILNSEIILENFHYLDINKYYSEDLNLEMIYKSIDNEVIRVIKYLIQKNRKR